MGWERRTRGGWYYTRSRKVAGRVVREYVGGGEWGHIMAAADALDRAERQAAANALRDEQARIDGANAPVNEFCEMVETLTRGVLMVAGYRRHHRGEWRKRRDR